MAGFRWPTGFLRQWRPVGISVRRIGLGFAILLAAALSIQRLPLLLSHATFSTAPPLLAGLLLGVAIADFLGGVVHWACDTWGSETTRWAGPGLIRFFRDHHRAPHGILEHDWIEVNGEACVAVSAFLLLCTSPVIRPVLADHVLLEAAAWSLATFAGGANQLHKWGHMRRPPGLVRLAQHWGLFLSLQRHAEHHRAPHTKGYCITTGWLNPVLDAARFWRGLEYMVTLITGIDARAIPDPEQSTRRARVREQA